MTNIAGKASNIQPVKPTRTSSTGAKIAVPTAVSILDQLDGETNTLFAISNLIFRASKPYYCEPYDELAFGMVMRAGTLYQEEKIKEEAFLSIVHFADKISTVPMDLLLINWFQGATATLIANYMMSSEKDDA